MIGGRKKAGKKGQGGVEANERGWVAYAEDRMKWRQFAKSVN